MEDIKDTAPLMEKAPKMEEEIDEDEPRMCICCCCECCHCRGKLYTVCCCQMTKCGIISLCLVVFFAILLILII